MSMGVVKSFHHIPGPRSYPLVGTLPYYLPIVGKYRFDELHVNGLKKYQEFGAVVREELVPGTNIVWVFAPRDIHEVFKREGRFPERRSHLALEHLRLSRPRVYNTGGLLPTNGSEWHRLRSAFQKGLSSPRNVRAYLPQVNQVGDEFVDHIQRTHRPGKDFLPDLSRFFLEVLGLVAFDHRLNSFSERELRTGSRSTTLMESALTINSCILKTDNGLRLWRFWNTPMYEKLKNAHEYIETVAMNLVKSRAARSKWRSCDKSLLETYLSSTEVDFKDVVGMSVDMLLAGVDTITYSTAFALYHLATNPEKQEKVHAESRRLLTEAGSAVTSEALAGAEYLKAALKESLRLNPVSVGVGRILPEEAVFSGYRVPGGTIVVTQNQVACRLDEFFPEASKFIPERWLKGSEFGEKTDLHSYLVLPFGHGPRACIARRLAEQNMQAIILKISRNFVIGWQGRPLGIKSCLINKPDRSVTLTFEPR